MHDKPLLPGNLFKAGLIQLKQICPHGVFISLHEFLQCFYFPGITFLDYHNLIQSIPLAWRHIINSGYGKQYKFVFKYDQVARYKSVVNAVYYDINWDLMRLTKKLQKWENKYDISITIEPFIKLINAMYKITNYVKLRTFHYKVKMWAVVTNQQLHQWKVVENNLCSFCEQEIEMIEHLLWQCPVVQQLWTKISFWINHIQNLNHCPPVQLSEQSVMLNNIMEDARHVNNLLVLSTKYFIYKQRCLKEDLNIHHLRNEIMLHHRMEMLGALSKGKIHIHDRKWQGVIQIISNL